METLYSYQFANPEFFLLLVLLPIYFAVYFFKQKKNQLSMGYSDTNAFAVKTSFKLLFRYLLPVIRSISFILLVFCLARPQSSSSRQSIKTDGIDIVIAIDISTSMLAEDFSPNRLEAAKQKAIDFVKNRPNDRIGLVIFSGESFTQCPVTIDHNVLINQIKNLKTGLFQDGTAIGSGLATAVSRLKDSKAKSKVIILLTDGKNNSGVVSPETGSDIAKTFGVRVYTIAVGKYGQAMMPFMTPNGKQYQQVEVDIDEDVLKNIANITKGEFFRATDNKSLSVIYSRIDKLEKSKIEVSYYNRKTEEYLPFLVIAASLLLLEYMMRLLIYRFSI